MDIFIEKLITRKKTGQDLLLLAGLILGGIVVIFAALSIPVVRSFWPILAAGIIYLIYYLITSRNIEYEYIVTNGDLDIDIIIAQRKRKRIFSASCKNFDIVARVNSENYNQDTKNIRNSIKAVSSMDSPNVYFVTLNYKGERTVLYFEPDDRILNAFRSFIPRKVMK